MLYGERGAIEWNVRLDEVGGWIAEASELAGARHEILHVAHG